MSCELADPVTLFSLIGCVRPEELLTVFWPVAPYLVFVGVSLRAGFRFRRYLRSRKEEMKNESAEAAAVR